MNDRIRFVIDSQAIVKGAGLLSNSIILTANAWLISHNVVHQVRERKAMQTAERMQFAAEVASAVAGVARVILNAVEKK
jgi:hypothetical protein